MKAFLIGLCFLVIGGCASSQLTQYARAQTAYNAALTVATANAETCVIDPESPACFVKDDTALRIEQARSSVKVLLDRAYEGAVDGDDGAVNEALDLLEVALAELNSLLAKGETQ